MSTRLCMMALAVLAAAAPAMAAGELSRQDRSFAEEAMAGSTMEVQLGKLATEKAQNDAVKKFGQRMATDHAQANQKLTDIATRAGMQAPNELPREQRRQVDKLSKMQGAEFDRAYMAAMVDDHKKDVRAFEKQAQKGSNPDLQAFAQQTVPTLKEHLQLAQDTEAALKSGQTSQRPQ